MGAKPYYGWLMLAGLFLEYMALIGIVFYTLPLFYPLLIAEYGWTPSQVTLPATFSYFAGAVLTPLASPLFDRYSVRKFMAFGLLCVIAGLALYSVIASLAFMLYLYALFALGQVFAGQVPVMLLVSRWFSRRRGLAIGIALIAPSLGGALFPLLLQDAFTSGNWRASALTLAAAGTLMLALALLLIRDRPEDMKLSPDGAQWKAGTTRGTSEPQGPTLREALRTPDFYLLAFATGALWFGINGIIQHQGIFLTREFALGTARLPLVISLFFWGAIVGKLLFGWLADRFDKLLMMLSSVVLLFLGLLWLRLEGERALFPYALSYGFGFGGTLTMIQLLFAEYYAGAQYGRILGVLTTVDVAAGGLGIPALGLLQQRLGGYPPALDVLTALTVVVAMTVGVLYRRRRPRHSTFGSKATSF